MEGNDNTFVNVCVFYSVEQLVCVAARFKIKCKFWFLSQSTLKRRRIMWLKILGKLLCIGRFEELLKTLLT